MKRIGFAMLALVALAALAQAADYGDNSTPFNPRPNLTGGKAPDGTVKSAHVDQFGATLSNDTARDRDFKLWTTPISDTTATASVDSTVSGPYYTGQMSRMWLRVQVTWPNAVHDSLGATQKFVRFAAQIRGHLTAATDSLNSSPWWVYTDSTRTKSFPAGFGGALASGDTLGYRMVTASSVPSQTIILPTELGPFYAARPPLGTGSSGSNLLGEPTTFYIPLADARGVYFWAPYTSVRIRVLGNYDNDMSHHGFNAPKFIVDIVGTSLR